MQYEDSINTRINIEALPYLKKEENGTYLMNNAKHQHNLIEGYIYI